MKRVKVTKELLRSLRELAFQRGLRTKWTERYDVEFYEYCNRDGGVSC